MIKPMTAKDQRLLDTANSLHFTDWYFCQKLEAEAESEEAKRMLHDQASRLYRKEEAFAGLL